MIRVFFDAEFTQLVDSPKLISIAFIDETGTREFYAELSDTWRLDEAGDFARAVVLPLLEGNAAHMTMSTLRISLGDWLKAFNEPVKLATDNIRWDWPWINTIFSESDEWPETLERLPLPLTINYLNQFDEFEPAVERAYASGLRRHHALDDAKAIRLGWLAAGKDIELDAT